MFVDIAFPERNEKKFIDIAKKLGTKNLIFVYKNVPELNIVSKGVKIYFGLLTDGKKRNKKEILVFRSSPKNRKVLESGSADFIFELEAAGLLIQ